MSAITILDMYPTHLNVNGDGGNVLALTRRLQWAGIASRVERAEVGATWWDVEPDILHIGGGTIAAQKAVLADLTGARTRLHAWAADGVSILGVAGGFHLLLDEVLFPGESNSVAGVGLLGGRSLPAEERISEYMVARAGSDLVHGYQNSGQLVDLAADSTPWARVLAGVGNGAPEGTEGAVRGTVLGTSLNGPLLPRNPLVADAILAHAAARRGLEYVTGPQHAHADAVASQASAVIRERLGVKD
ncbi:hypothetical protein B0I08_103368 [Glaciihabitans tibetensis]|uniref:Lipid II isoglutaminyl synthase (glutamine-hydrolyzing) subunit GatD n=1 Tax=Glaciihabitans tibetensis TaxID=1266600 RepID=A0A2T0VG27_9MICO|nr:hypothetical protein [Glaciihabitans tibetensis]PRY69160.1 hypothetical protein B0I08_103368 [Glaciihabitans tibetensis]